MIDNVGDALQVKLLIHADSNMDVVCHDPKSLLEATGVGETACVAGNSSNEMTTAKIV